jgi:hypothetical protein
MEESSVVSTIISDVKLNEKKTTKNKQSNILLSKKNMEQLSS